MGASSAKTVIRQGFGICRCIVSALLLLIPAARASTPAPLPILRTARQVHTLSRADADRGLPVHLARAQIIYFQPSVWAFFLMDQTDGIYFSPRPGFSLPLHAGDIVSVDGVTASGAVAPIILQAQLRILGHARLPAAPLVSFDRLSSGAVDSRWVSLQGIVRSLEHPAQRVNQDGHTTFDQNNLILNIASGTQLLEVVTRLPTGPIPHNLVDAEVRLRAAVGSRFNQRNQLIGAHLYMPDLSLVQILQPAPRDPFALPLTTVTGIARIGSREPGHRVRIRGIVTSAFDDHHFSLMDSEHGIFVTTQDSVSVHPGDLLDVSGFPSDGDYTSYLDGALVRHIGSAPLPHPVPLTAAEAFDGIYDAEPIQLEGILLERYGAGEGARSFQLGDHGRKFIAVLPPGSKTASLDTLRVGSRLRVTGICVIHTGVTQTPQSMDILLRSPADIQVLRAAPWWTPRHTLILATILTILVLIIFTRNLGLRRRVAAQTGQIQAQLDESRALRIQAEAATQEKSQTLASLLTAQNDLLLAQEKLRYQATHDALTGLWNRAALLDFLHKETQRAFRTHGTLGILLLDVDHFKPVNDTYGHLAGDAVLREIALRITRSTRPYDIAGRYGGEEFLILLPDCDHSQTENSAERIRSAIGAQPFHAGNARLSLTVSIGATVAFDALQVESLAQPRDSDAELLSRADLALYQAKSAGRNCTILRLAEAVSV